MATSSLNDLKIPYKTAYELQDKRAAIEAIMNADAVTADKVKQILTSPKAKNLLVNNWLLIKMKL